MAPQVPAPTAGRASPTETWTDTKTQTTTSVVEEVEVEGLLEEGVEGAVAWWQLPQPDPLVVFQMFC